MKTCLLLALLMLTGCADARQPDPRQYAVRLEITQGENGKVCGATKVGPATARTAKHCMEDSGVLTMDGVPVRVVSVVERSSDVVDVTVEGLTFKQWAKPGKAKTGERIRWWGNPRGIPDVLREGVAVAARDGLVVVDAMICHGDSGSGMFNERGELVGVISRMGPQLMDCSFAIGESA